VLATEGVEVVDYEVLDAPGVERASDHRPVLVTVRVPRG
jgi:endonuclease/exonuclease/phosphatase family metal-dependent hydrolase